MLQANVAEKILKSLGSISPVQSSIIPSFAVAQTSIPVAINGKNISLNCITGNLWVSLLGGTVTALNGYLLTAGGTIEGYVAGNVSVISDVTGATCQILVWEVKYGSNKWSNNRFKWSFTRNNLYTN
jgi:hypothetical protein